MPTPDDDNDKNAPYRSARRAARKRPPKHTRGQDRRLTIRSEQRKQPDVRKIARAIIAMAMAEHEAVGDAIPNSEAIHRRGDDHDVEGAHE